MTKPRISGLGHVSIFVEDLDRQITFYRDILGLQVSDEDQKMGIAFLSAEPEIEHHHVVLLRGRQTEPGTRWLQHIGFRCNEMTEVLELRRRLIAADTTIDMALQHGNALAIYFADPEGNLCEAYWPTGLKARQPFGLGIDFDQSPDEIMRQIEESVRMYGETGVVDAAALSEAARSAVTI